VARIDIQYEDTWTILGDLVVQPFNVGDDKVFNRPYAVGALDENIRMSAEFPFASLRGSFGNQLKRQLLSSHGDCAKSCERCVIASLTGISPSLSPSQPALLPGSQKVASRSRPY
jgi:hypothetical protein